MKRMKKLLAVMLAALMVVSMGGMSVMAESGSYKITINNSTSGYKYTAYQIFDGDLYKGVLSNIVWGDAISESSQATALAAVQAISVSGATPFSSCTSAADIATVLSSETTDSAILQAFAETISVYATQNGVESGEYSSGTYTVSGIAAGYYLVVSSEVPTDGAYTRYILTVVGDATVDTKSDVATVDKEVSTATANIGDTVTYTLTATLPSNYADYDAYTLIFHDTLSSGLTYSDGSITVTVYNYVDAQLTSAYGDDTYYTYDNGTYTVVDKDNETYNSTTTYYVLTGTVVESGVYTYTPGYTKADVDQSTFEANKTGYYTYNSGVYTRETDASSYSNNTQYYTQNATGTLEIRIDDANSLEASGSTPISVSSSSLIVVTYNAKLNSSAVIGNGDGTDNGNTNTVNLEYSNNPNSGGSGSTGTTTTDLVSVFTLQLDVTKKNSTEDENLSGAEFILYKDVEGTTYYAQVDADNKVTGWTQTKNDASTLTSSTNGTFSIIGLATGTYKLEETKAPDGYNLLSDAITIVVEATYTTDDDGDNTAIATLTATADTKNLTTSISKGTVDLTVLNNSGSTIPTTGGIGTTIFYIVGAVLVLGAGVVLITRRRMASR